MKAASLPPAPPRPCSLRACLKLLCAWVRAWASDAHEFSSSSHPAQVEPSSPPPPSSSSPSRSSSRCSAASVFRSFASRIRPASSWRFSDCESSETPVGIRTEASQSNSLPRTLYLHRRPDLAELIDVRPHHLKRLHCFNGQGEAKSTEDAAPVCPTRTGY